MKAVNSLVKHCGGTVCKNIILGRLNATKSIENLEYVLDFTEK